MRKLSAVPILLALLAVGAAGARAESVAGPAVLTPAELDAVTGGQSLAATTADTVVDSPVAFAFSTLLGVTVDAYGTKFGIEFNPPPIELNSPVNPAF
jgi:hypothetical protein